jgi:hypothetical protein
MASWPDALRFPKILLSSPGLPYSAGKPGRNAVNCDHYAALLAFVVKKCKQESVERDPK